MQFIGHNALKIIYSYDASPFSSPRSPLPSMPSLRYADPSRNFQTLLTMQTASFERVDR